MTCEEIQGLLFATLPPSLVPTVAEIECWTAEQCWDALEYVYGWECGVPTVSIPAWMAERDIPTACVQDRTWRDRRDRDESDALGFGGSPGVEHAWWSQR